MQRKTKNHKENSSPTINQLSVVMEHGKPPNGSFRRWENRQFPKFGRSSQKSSINTQQYLLVTRHQNRPIDYRFVVRVGSQHSLLLQPAPPPVPMVRKTLKDLSPQLLFPYLHQDDKLSVHATTLSVSQTVKG